MELPGFAKSLAEKIQRFLKNRSGASSRTFCIVSGDVRAAGSGDPLFAARVRHSSSRRATTTRTDGSFELSIPCYKAHTRQSLIVLMPEFWPAKITFPARGTAVALRDGQCALRPIPAFFTKSFWGGILSVFGPGLVHLWYGSTRIEKIAAGVFVLILLPPLFVFAVDRGLRVAGTSFDEDIREYVQRLTWFPSKRLPIEDAKLRMTYHPGIEYVLTPGTYKVADDTTITAEKHSRLTIMPGVRLELGRGASLLFKGQLLARGTQEQKIVFQRTSPEQRWGNLTFWGDGATGSVLGFCEISGGSGKNVLASEQGYFERATIGKRIGGGLLIYDCAVKISNVSISDCESTFGGGAYVRNHPDRAVLPGSVFESVSVENCRASSGGGGVLLKAVYPEFRDCVFKNNATDGRSACGGALFVGAEAKANLTRCRFFENKASAEGGAIYAYMAGETDKQHTCGVVIDDCQFKSNTAGGTGGAVSAYNSRLWVNQSRFNDNVVKLFIHRWTRRSGRWGVVRQFRRKLRRD